MKKAIVNPPRQNSNFLRIMQGLSETAEFVKGKADEAAFRVHDCEGAVRDSNAANPYKDK